MTVDSESSVKDLVDVYRKGSVHCDQVGFVPGMKGWLTPCKLVNVINCVNEFR